jgi:hypothetical protein
MDNAWIQTGTSELTGSWEAELTSLGLIRVDRGDVEWFNLESGSSIVLANDGGWREPEWSRYRVFHRSATGLVSEISFGMIGGEGKYDPTQTGSGTYEAAYTRCVELIGGRLGVVVL